MLTKRDLLVKRIFDLGISVLLLPFVIIPLFLLFVLASIDARRSGLFIQKRIGQHGGVFRLFKLRSLRGDDHVDIVSVKANETVFGRWLRKTKFDELPQLFNVLNGTMSYVGPRPDIPGYADKLVGEDEIILSVKPGITGPATIKYKNEEQLLLNQENPSRYNDEVIWPDKVSINKEYVRNWSLKKDIKYLIKYFV